MISSRLRGIILVFNVSSKLALDSAGTYGALLLAKVSWWHSHASYPSSDPVDGIMAGVFVSFMPGEVPGERLLMPKGEWGEHKMYAGWDLAGKGGIVCGMCLGLWRSGTTTVVSNII